MVRGDKTTTYMKRISELIFYFVHSDYMKKLCEIFFVQDAPVGTENTRCNTNERQPCLSGNYRQLFVSWFSDVNGVKDAPTCGGASEIVHVLLQVRMEAVAQMNRKTLRAQTKLDITLCLEGISGSCRSRVQCPSLCHRSTLLLGHVPDDH